MIRLKLFNNENKTWDVSFKNDAQKQAQLCHSLIDNES
jgi:hypothetical protein